MPEKVKCVDNYYRRYDDSQWNWTGQRSTFKCLTIDCEYKVIEENDTHYEIEVSYSTPSGSTAWFPKYHFIPLV